MEKSGLMPVECVMASCDNVIWRAYRAPAVVLSKKIAVSARWKSDILVEASVRPLFRRAASRRSSRPAHRDLTLRCTRCLLQRQARASRSVAPSQTGAGALDRAVPEVPEHPSFQEYCRVCMTKIRAVEQKMRDSVETKDLEQLELAIEIGNSINVVRAVCEIAFHQDADHSRMRLRALAGQSVDHAGRRGPAPFNRRAGADRCDASCADGA